MLRLILSVLVVFVALNATPTAVHAEEGVVAEKKEETLKTGVIASFGKGPRSGAVDVNTAGEAAGSEPSPISASVKREGNQCIAVLQNSSEENSYSVQFAMIGTGNRGQRLFRKTYSASIRPGKSIERSTACQRDANVAVELRSGKKL